MRFSTRKVQLLLIPPVALFGVVVTADPVAAMPAPSGVAVHFSESAATITWNQVPGSRGYGITIRPVGANGPYGEEEVLGDSYTLPFTKFPGYGSHKKGYAYVVCSVDGHGKRTCTTLKDSFYVHSEGHGVSTSDLHKAAAKISSCLGTGEKAAVVTAAESGSVLAAATWIPGVNGITAADVGAAAAGQGGYKFATCLLDW